MNPTTDHEHDSGFHPLNIGHLVMGIALLGLVGVWALWQNEVVVGDDVHWLLPIPWVLAGVVGLTATAVTGSRRHAVRQTGWVTEGTEPGTGAGWRAHAPAGQGNAALRDNPFP